MGNKVALYDLWAKNYKSKWSSSYGQYAFNLIEDEKIRSLLFKLDDYYGWGISKIIIERSDVLAIEIAALKPGAIIGKTGADLAVIQERVKGILVDLRNTNFPHIGKAGLGKNVQIKKSIPEIKIQVNPIRKPEIDSASVAKKIAFDISKGKQYKFLIKRYIADCMRFGAKGIKVLCSGRLGGVEIARKFGLSQGSVPRQTISANIDYSCVASKTNSGLCGVKVWIYKGSRRGE